MLNGILLVVLGLLSVPSLVLNKKPNAKELFDKVAPIQGWFGVIFALWGIWGIISSIIHINILTLAPMAWILSLLVSVVTAVLGFILGYGLIQKYALGKNEKAREKGEQTLKKLLPLQGTFGIIAIVLGLLAIIGSIVWRVA